MEKADHPYQAAVHLMRALKCCKQCDISEEQLLQMQELEIKKQMLSEELLTVIQRAEGITILSNEVSELAALVADLRQENDLCYKQGLQTIQVLNGDRKKAQLTEREAWQLQLTAERNLSRQLTNQLNLLTQKVKQLNRINDDLVHRLCDY